MGVSGTLVLGVLLAWWSNRGRLEQGATWMGQVKEGQRSRRVAIFDKYVTIDREIVVPTTVEKAAVEGESLMLRYVDPVAEGPVLREFAAPRSDLTRIADALQNSA